MPKLSANKKDYLSSVSPNDFIVPLCFVCEKPVDCVVETPCETNFHTKCFNEVRNGMGKND